MKFEKCSRKELEAYIGIQSKGKFFSKALDKYEKNRNSAIWNFGAFFLGPFYLMYRKCYIISLIVAIPYLMSIFSTTRMLSFIFILIIMILLGLFGTTVYLQHVEKEINILSDYNYTKSEADFQKLLSSKGGTSFAAGAILYFGLISLMWLIIFTT